MKIVVLALVCMLSSGPLLGQQLPLWERIYTFEESIIEINTSNLVIGGNIARATFRWSFDRPENSNSQFQQKYKSRQEVFEFNCSDKRYRPYEITFFDDAGKLIGTEEGNPPDKWLTVASGSMIERLYAPACQLFERKTMTHALSSGALESEKVARYIFSFSQSLEQSKDFKPLIENFFATDYLDRYLHDKETNWFFNLDRDVAAQASRAELERFYVALMNTGYLSCLFFVSQYHYVEQGLLEEKLIPADVIELINNHPYTVQYKGRHENYDYLAENIDSLQRLRSYTDLLESIGALMRKRVVNAHSEDSKEYRQMRDYHQSETRICDTGCLGLPKGTRLIEVHLPLLHLQVATIRGELKIVSATDSAH